MLIVMERRGNFKSLVTILISIILLLAVSSIVVNAYIIDLVMPNRLIISRQVNTFFHLSAFTTTITDKKVIRKLYKDLDGFELWPPNVRSSCPMIPALYQPRLYLLDFYKDNKLMRHITFSPGGCRDSISLENHEVRVAFSREGLNLAKDLQKVLKLPDIDFFGLPTK